MTKIYIAHVVTESADNYIWLYTYKPSIQELIERVCNEEGGEDMEWYRKTTSFRIIEEYLKGSE